VPKEPKVPKESKEPKEPKEPKESKEPTPNKEIIEPFELPQATMLHRTSGFMAREEAVQIVLKNEDDSDTDAQEASFITKKKSIPKHVKTLVWNKYIGSDKAKALCMSCKQEEIGIRSFHCGHVIAEARGGDMTINNLRPICAACNGSMGTMSMNEFTSQFFGWSI
jgi:hypothetical protein